MEQPFLCLTLLQSLNIDFNLPRWFCSDATPGQLLTLIRAGCCQNSNIRPDTYLDYLGASQLSRDHTMHVGLDHAIHIGFELTLRRSDDVLSQ